MYLSLGTIKKNRCPDRSDGIVSSLPHDRQTNHPTNQTDGHEGWQGSCALSLWRKRGRTKKCSRSFFECFFLTFWSLIYFYLVYTHWRRGKTEKDQSPEYYKIFRKNTIFNEHPVYKSRYQTFFPIQISHLLPGRSICDAKCIKKNKYPICINVTPKKIKVISKYNAFSNKTTKLQGNFFFFL